MVFARKQAAFSGLFLMDGLFPLPSRSLMRMLSLDVTSNPENQFPAIAASLCGQIWLR